MSIQFLVRHQGTSRQLEKSSAQWGISDGHDNAILRSFFFFFTKAHSGGFVKCKLLEKCFQNTPSEQHFSLSPAVGDLVVQCSLWCSEMFWWFMLFAISKRNNCNCFCTRLKCVSVWVGKNSLCHWIPCFYLVALKWPSRFNIAFIFL